jgi:hypothetical protein
VWCAKGGRLGEAYSGLAGVVETEEEQLSVLVCKPELGEHVPNCEVEDTSACVSCYSVARSQVCGWPKGVWAWVVKGINIHQSTIHILCCDFLGSLCCGWYGASESVGVCVWVEELW